MKKTKITIEEVDGGVVVNAECPPDVPKFLTTLAIGCGQLIKDVVKNSGMGLDDKAIWELTELYYITMLESMQAKLPVQDLKNQYKA